MSIGKSAAIKLLRRNGHLLNGEITYAAKNSGNDVYWANPNIEFLEKNWFLILDDTNHKTLYLFNIEANSIDPKDIKVRSDQPKKIDLNIEYLDENFTDIRSNLRFYPFLIADENY